MCEECSAREIIYKTETKAKDGELGFQAIKFHGAPCTIYIRAEGDFGGNAVYQLKKDGDDDWSEFIESDCFSSDIQWLGLHFDSYKSLPAHTKKWIEGKAPFPMRD